MVFKEKIATAFLALPAKKGDVGVSPVLVKFYGTLPRIDHKMEVIVSFVGLTQGNTYYVETGIYFNGMPCHLDLDSDGNLNEPRKFLALNEGFDENNVPMILNIAFQSVDIENYGIHEIKVTLYDDNHKQLDTNSYYFDAVKGVVFDTVKGTAHE